MPQPGPPFVQLDRSMMTAKVTFAVPVASYALAALMLLGGVANAASSTVILTGGKSALPGSAYSSDRQDFIGGQCVTGTLKPTGTSESSFQLDQTISESTLSSELGFGLATHARFGAVDASLSANFLSRSMSNAFSISAIYSAQYLMQPGKMDTATVHLLQPGTEAKNTGNFEKWTQTCGDSFVDEIRKGGFSSPFELISRLFKKSRSFQASLVSLAPFGV
jgi:hypothetical protein